MAEHDDDSLDPDRAAILARRRHFVALALSGLATTACTDGKPEGSEVRPPSTEPSPVERAGTEPGSEPGSVTEGETDSEALHPPPQACLKMAMPEPGETGEDQQAPPEPPPKPDPKPRPCLKKAAPNR
jgi:hypothetical protein